MDFGVAKPEAAAQHTRPGGIAGKLAYLAPEYLRSDSRSIAAPTCSRSA